MEIPFFTHSTFFFVKPSRFSTEKIGIWSEFGSLDFGWNLELRWQSLLDGAYCWWCLFKKSGYIRVYFAWQLGLGYFGLVWFSQIFPRHVTNVWVIPATCLDGVSQKTPGLEKEVPHSLQSTSTGEAGFKPGGLNRTNTYSILNKNALDLWFMCEFTECDFHFFWTSNSFRGTSLAWLTPWGLQRSI